MAEKRYIRAQDLLDDAFRLGLKVLDSGFRPDFIVGIWRGGTPVGIAVQELFEHHGFATDHIAIRTAHANGSAARPRMKPIGVFLGGQLVPSPDGEGQLLRAVATLWEKDFPNEVKAIQQYQADLGASYEIEFEQDNAAPIAPDVLTLTRYVFSGAAILFRASAAYKETGVLVATAGDMRYATTQVDLPADLAASLAPWQQRAFGGLQGFAEEGHPHVTVRYGFTEPTPEAVAAALAGSGAVSVAFGGLGRFYGDQEDVIFVRAESDALRRLNGRLAGVPHQEADWWYEPHLTLGTVPRQGWDSPDPVGAAIAPSG